MNRPLKIHNMNFFIPLTPQEMTRHCPKSPLFNSLIPIHIITQVEIHQLLVDEHNRALQNHETVHMLASHRKIIEIHTPPSVCNALKQ